MLNVTVGSAQSHENLTIFPLLAVGVNDDLPFALLVDALAAGTLSIGEVGQGSVPALLAHNSPTKVRRRARETEHRHATAGLVASPAMLREAQGAVWADIAETAAKIGGHSPTGALDNIFAMNVACIDTWLTAFPGAPAQVGLLAFVGGSPLALDIIASPRLYDRVHGRLLRGYVLDAIERLGNAAAAGSAQAAQSGPVSDADRSPSHGAADPSAAPARSVDAQRFLDRVRTAARVDTPTVGRGRYNVLTGTVIGGELLDADRLVHLSAFPATAAPSHGQGRAERDAQVAPPSRRRHHRGGGPV